MGAMSTNDALRSAMWSCEMGRSVVSTGTEVTVEGKAAFQTEVREKKDFFSHLNFWSLALAPGPPGPLSPNVEALSNSDLEVTFYLGRLLHIL